MGNISTTFNVDDLAPYLDDDFDLQEDFFQYWKNDARASNSISLNVNLLVNDKNHALKVQLALRILGC